MKMPIAWHEDNLRNWRRTIAEEAERVANIQAALKRSIDECNFFETQITEAKRKKKDGFDQDRFLKKE